VELAKAGAEGVEAEEGRKRGFRRARGGGRGRQRGGCWMDGGGGRRWPLEEGQSGGRTRSGGGGGAGIDQGRVNGTIDGGGGLRSGAWGIVGVELLVAVLGGGRAIGGAARGGRRGLWRVVDDGHACRKVCEEKEEEARGKRRRVSEATQTTNDWSDAMASGRDEVKSLSNDLVTYRTVNARAVAGFGAKIRPTPADRDCLRPYCSLPRPSHRRN
jgi:hypothetical protein